MATTVMAIEFGKQRDRLKTTLIQKPDYTIATRLMPVSLP